MTSNLSLKSKSYESVIYYYNIDSAETVGDGEVGFFMKNHDRRVLKGASSDDDGFHARRIVLPHLHRIIFDEGCPQERVIVVD